MTRASKYASLLLLPCALAGCAVAPTHPALTGEDLPSLLPVRAFVANADYNESYRISPDGRTIAWRGVSRLRPAILWRDVGDGRDGRDARDGRVFDLRFSKRAPRPIWAADSRTILYHSDPSGRENHHVYAIDTRAAEAEPRDLTPYPGIKAFIVHVPFDVSENIYVMHNRRDPAVFDLYAIHVDSGAETLLLENTENVIGMLIDDDGEIRSRVRQTEDARYLEVPEGGAWRTLVRASKFDALYPVALSRGGRALYVLGNVGRDKRVLSRLDLATGSAEVLYAHPEVDVDRVKLSPRDRRPLTVQVSPGYPVTDFLDEALRDGLAALPVGKRAGVHLASIDRNERTATVNVYDHSGARFYLVDLETGAHEQLDVSSSYRKRQHFVEMRPVSFDASDGMTLHGYLSLPRLAQGKRLPTVLYVHGGPWSRDRWGYNTTVQFLVNRGYAVLQVNYRGSSGYGRRYMHAAEGEFAGRMHEDLLDAVDWAVAQGFTDPGRVAIMGASFGGYAALVGMAMTPGRFACGVDAVGVSDLAGLVESAPPYWRPYMHLWHRFAGDPSDPDQRRRMDSRSPLYFAGDVRGPLLILHGVNDPRVHIDQSERMVAALRKAGKPVEYVVFDDEGHGFGHWKNQMTYHRRIEDFLAPCLGGRSSGFDYYQLGSWMF